MDLHYLKIFHILARNLSFTKTADELHISQPAISMQIKNLETQLGFKLFERYGKTIYLSKEGYLVYGYTQKIFGLINDMESDINHLRGSMSGKIGIGASNTPGIYIIPQILGAFHQKHPNVTLNLHIGNTYTIQEKLTHNELDFAIIGGNIDVPKTFTVEEIVKDNVVLVASPKNVLSSLQSIDPGMLSNQQYITHDETSQLYKFTEKILDRLKLPLNIAMTLDSVEAIKNAVAANLGISFVPYSSVRKDVESGTLSVLNVNDKPWKYPFSLVYCNSKTFTAPITLIIEMLKNEIKQIVTG